MSDIFEMTFRTTPPELVALTICRLVSQPHTPTESEMMNLARWIQGYLSVQGTPARAEVAFGHVTYQRAFPLPMRRFLRGYCVNMWDQLKSELPTLPSFPSRCGLFLELFLEAQLEMKGGSM